MARGGRGRDPCDGGRPPVPRRPARGPGFVDRGVAGRDLVDALDGWACLGLGDLGDATSGLQGNVVGLHQFDYDFAPQPSCR